MIDVDGIREVSSIREGTVIRIQGKLLTVISNNIVWKILECRNTFGKAVIVTYEVFEKYGEEMKR